MAQHKAPTAVTIAPTSAETPLQPLVQRFWIPAAFVAVAVAGAILFWQWKKQQTQAEARSTWGQLASKLSTDPATRLPEADPAVMSQIAVQERDNATGAWARLLEARGYADRKSFDQALAALDALRAEHPEHPLVRQSYPVVAGAASQSVIDLMQASLRAQKEWEATHSSLFSNPPPPTNGPKVRLNTTKGAIVVQLYPDKAPRHVENFLKLAQAPGTEGYNGTKFHRTIPGFMIQGGDPNSRSEDVTSWGQGGPDYTIPPEPNDLSHFAGVLSMAKKPTDYESSGSQFFITTNDAHHLDGVHTVFGVVVEGMDVVQQIASGEIAKDSGDRPASPVVLESVEVLPGS